MFIKRTNESHKISEIRTLAKNLFKLEWLETTVDINKKRFLAKINDRNWKARRFQKIFPAEIKGTGDWEWHLGSLGMVDMEIGKDPVLKLGSFW